jgi:hypothetical protein
MIAVRLCRVISRIAALVVIAIACQLRADPAPGQIDTFQDGTARNWFTGGGPSGQPATPPAVISTGGPGGAGDAFMSLIALGGNGPRSRLTVANSTQWAGNYVAAGVTLIEMDVNNRGTNDLSLRIGVADTSPTGPQNAAFTTSAIFLPAGSGWVHVSFPFAQTDLTPLIGNAQAALAAAASLHLYHSPSPNFPNPVNPIPAIVADLGVDNIRAVPEPSIAWACLMVSALYASHCRRRGR